MVSVKEASKRPPQRDGVMVLGEVVLTHAMVNPFIKKPDGTSNGNHQGAAGFDVFYARVSELTGLNPKDGVESGEIGWGTNHTVAYLHDRTGSSGSLRQITVVREDPQGNKEAVVYGDGVWSYSYSRKTGQYHRNWAESGREAEEMMNISVRSIGPKPHEAQRT